MKYFFRILALPFFVGLLFVALLRSLLWQSWQFIANGGEAIAYSKKTRQTINDLFKKLEQ